MEPAHPDTAVARSSDERRQILARAIQTQIAPTMRIESMLDYQAVLVFGSKPNHILHFLIGLFTVGLWWIAWLLIAVTTRETRRMITVDEHGRISSRDY